MRINNPVWGFRCPDEVQWAKLAANLIHGREAERLLKHAVNCQACSATLKESLLLLVECDVSESSPDVEDEFDSMIPMLAQSVAERARERFRFREVAADAGALIR